MKMYLKFLMAIILPLVSSCSNQHLINDSEYMKLVDSSFNERKVLAANRTDNLFSVFDQSLVSQDRQKH